MTTITIERVTGISNGEKCYTHDDVVELARIALASLEAEPVAWSTDSSLIVNSRVITIYKSVADSWIEKGMRVVPLYTAPPAPVDLTAENEELKRKLYAVSKRNVWLEGALSSQAAVDVLAERQRQILSEGWTPEHDDEHGRGEMAMAAVCYINETGTVNRNGGKPWGWPWDASWWKPNTRRRNLVKAGALILAEIERGDRAFAGREEGN
ncbi:hypothetical protein [Trabulsiella odontotermitis]|uniref:hypothetical protein n=1 Tax=Trabulsiella odontotermitis TaxID=379893 RepID=UPI000ABA07DA|nr:hypothetical protein [Trabulsiella odontotermitis]